MIKSSRAALEESPLQRGNAADQVFVKLREQILQGTLARGTKLPSERELAQRYQVSAPTIREAVRGLAAVRGDRTGVDTDRGGRDRTLSGPVSR